jgi:uncharacterized protein YdhG (YjbR/CyaY superfamily)
MKKTPILNPAKTVDEYLDSFEDPVKSTLEKLRQTIKSAAPKAEEAISYQIPTYKYQGALVHFAAFEKHLSLFVVNKNILRMFEKDLKQYKTTGTTIHFSPEHPLPATLVRKIVQTRMKENEGLKLSKKAGKDK